MSAPTGSRTHTGAGRRVSVVVAATLGLGAGLLGTAFSMWLVWIAGLVVAIAGGIAAALGARRGSVLLTLGLALLLGSAAYFVLGMIQPDGPACGGVGCPSPS